MLLHHRLVDALVRQHVLARRIVHDHRRVRDDRGDVAVVDGVHVGRLGADAERAEAAAARSRLDDAVDVLALVGVFAVDRGAGRRARAARAQRFVFRCRHLDALELAASRRHSLRLRGAFASAAAMAFARAFFSRVLAIEEPCSMFGQPWCGRA